jgi:hypothetical protein
MSSEFTVLREAWLALDEPSEEVREAARARLFEEIANEESEQRLGRTSDEQLRPGGFRRRSRLALVLVLVLVLLLTWATLTLAFGWHVVFGSAPRVAHSSRVFQDFNHLDVGAPPKMASGVLPNQARLVAAFGRVRLWLAPTKAGGYCSVFAGSGGCDARGTIPLGVTYSFRTEPGQGGVGQGTDLAYLRELHGAVNPRWSDSVEVRFEDGTILRPRIVWVSKPIAQGFFYVAIGDEHHRPGHQVREVVARDGDGNVVDSSQPGPDSDGPPAGAIVDKADEVARIDTPVGNAVLWRAPSRFDTACTWLTLAGRFYLGRCLFKDYPAPPEIELVRRGELVLVTGVQIPSSGLVRLEFVDGHHVQLRATGGGFLLYRVPRPASLASAQPWRYTVLAPSGHRIARSELSLPSLRSPGDIDRTARMPDGEVVLLPRKAIIAKARKLIEFLAKNGSRYTVWTMPARDGGRCYVFGGGNCTPPGSHASPLGAGVQGGAVPVLAGQVREDVATYELHYEDGAVERVHPVESFILHEIPSSHYPRGHRLELVISRARDGHELARTVVPDRAPGVYPCENPIDIGGGGTICP